MLSRHYFLGLRNQDPQTYHGLNAMMDYMEAMAAQLGVEPAPAAQVAARASVPPPLPASGFQVVGVDGHFQIAITDNAANLQPVWHEIASATSMNFDAASGLLVYGPDARTQWTIPDPASSKYWRLRSKLLGSAFNSPQYFHAISSGAPIPVSSGLLRSAATAARTQHTANYLTVSAEYIAAGAALANGDTSDGTPSVDWAAGNLAWNGGATVQTVPKTTLRGLAAGATYILAWDTSTGTARYTSDGGQALADSEVYLATVTTPATLGAAASVAGGGPSATGISSNGGRYSYT
jgi:hypothetical protein